MTQSGRVIKAHKRRYDDPIQVKQGDVLKITKRELWNDRYPWVWCVAASGKEGWVPEDFIEMNGEEGSAKRDYNAIELTVKTGARLIIFEEVGGWYWAQNVRKQFGWVPVDCVALDLM